MSVNGPAIYEGIDFISRVYQECNTLAGVLTQSLSELLRESEVKSQYKMAEKKLHRGPRWQTDEGCYLYHSVADSFPLIRGRKKTADAYLFFQISLAGDGMRTDENKEPLIHIGLWTDEIDFAENSYMGFPLTLEHELEENVLLRWDWQWLYTLRLCSINSSADLEAKVIGPVRQLLMGKETRQALPITLEGLVRYTPAPNSVDQYHHQLSFQDESRL